MSEKYNDNTIEPPFKDGIYYFKKDKPIRCILFSDDELFRIGIAALIMKRLFKNLRRFDGVRSVYEELCDETKKHSCEVEMVDRRFRTFLFEWKLYTEHWKSYINDLNDSVWSDEFVSGYQKLFKSLMNKAFKNTDFVVVHILRNYVSHANDAIKYSHVDGKNNQFCIYRVTLEKFLKGSIDKTSNRRTKERLQAQLDILKMQEELIDLSIIADKAILWMEKCEKILLDYQATEPQLLQACNILIQAKQRIDEARIQSDVWELWTSQPMYLNHQEYHSFSLRVEDIIYTYYSIQLNWEGYIAVINYLMQLIEQ